MSTLSVIGGVVQPVVLLAGAPVLVGTMRQVRARLEGRAGAGILQPWRDIRKLLRKEPVGPRGGSEVFRAAPLVLIATAIVVATVAPFVTIAGVVEPAADLVAVVTLLALGTVALALAALDTGSAFGGMGASRGITILALVEPTLLVTIFALSTQVGSTNLGAIVSASLDDPGRVISPGSLLAAVAFLVVIIAETGRLPLGQPGTHHEPAMVHEALAQEYSGPDLALVELAAALRLSVLLGLLANLFLPWGIATSAGAAAIVTGVVVLVVKVAVLGALLAAAEVFLARLRLFRVPELLAGAFLLSVLALVV